MSIHLWGQAFLGSQSSSSNDPSHLSQPKMATDMYGRWIPDSNADNLYTQKGSVPSWFQSPTPSNNTYTRKGLATDMYGTPQPVASEQTTFVSRTDMYGTPQPVASEQSYRSTGVPSFLDPNYKGQTKTAFYTEIVKNVSDGESSGNDDSSEHGSSSVEDVTSSSSSENGSEYESSREVVDSEANESISDSESSQGDINLNRLKTVWETLIGI
ncbi:hypothetical protein HanPI659440_Chr09g0343631 [Helianthus annuus]|nr:hypothetical protein HanPI659440_Chr09g0343631 [Helianthus annuus]